MTPLPPPPPPEAHDKVPEPFVDKNWPLVPSALGKVHVTLDAIVPAALNAT
jgi:hypothetical protein